MPVATDTVQVGPCDVSFKGTALGLTKGGVKIEVSTDTHVVNVDQFGESAVDEFIKGRSVKLTVPMAESDLTKLLAVLPGATLVGTTVKKLVVPTGTGTSLRGTAGVLICHPVGRDATDKSQDFTVPLANCKGSFSFAYKLDDERVYEIEFTGFVDLDTSELFIMGDPDAV